MEGGSRDRQRSHRPPFLDVRSQNRDVPDDEIKEVYAYGAGLQSLSDIVGLYQLVNLEFLSLHGNHIKSMEGLERLHLLKELNLSSNNIERMEGLSHLCQLRVLNLSCNQIEEIMDVRGLVALRKLLLSHNRISSLGGLGAMHGPRYSLQTLDLRDNAVRSLSELDILAGCSHLMEVILSWGSHSNPVCEAPAYKSAIVAAVPHVLKLDGETLCPGPASIPGSQGLSLPGGNVWSENPAALLPSWVLQYRQHGLQKQILETTDRKELSSDFSVEPPQPQQVFLQPQPRVLVSSEHQNHQNVFLKGLYDSDLPHNLDPRPLYSKTTTSAISPYIATIPVQNDVQDFKFPESDLDILHKLPAAPGRQTSTWIDRPTSSNLLSMASLSHPNSDTILAPSHRQTFCAGKGLVADDHLSKRRGGLSSVEQTCTSSEKERNSKTESYQEVLSSCKVDSSNQTSPEAWFEVLEEKILGLVEQLSNIKIGSKVETMGPSHNARVPSNEASWRQLDYEDAFGQLWRKKNESYSESQEETADVSSGHTSDSHQNLESKCYEPKWETPARRWVQFGDKWKQKKALRWSDGQSGTGLDGTEDRKAFKHLCDEVRTLQADLASLTATCKWKEESQMKFEEQSKTTRLKEDEKDATICKLMEDYTLLKSQLVNLEEKNSEENKRLLNRLEEKHAATLELERIVQDKDEKVQELSGQVEQLALERDQQASCTQEKVHGEFFSLNTELISMKEALDVATCARQNAESALLDASAAMENSRQMASSFGQLLDEERAKLKVCKLELVRRHTRSRSHGLKLQKELAAYSRESVDAKDEKQKALEQLSRIHKLEMEEAIACESASGECRGAIAAEKSFEQLINAMKIKLLNAQKESQEAHQETGRIRQDMDNLREEKERQHAELQETIRSLILKDQEKETLVIELSSVVRSQKLKLKAVHLDLERLAEVEEELHMKNQEIIILRRRADRHDEMSLEIESLQQMLIKVTQDAEKRRESMHENFNLQFISLQKENKGMSAALEKLEASEDAVKIKNKMLESQNETIKELKLELSQANETLRKAVKTSDTLEADWINRYQTEADQGKDWQIKLAKQDLAMTALEQQLRFERAAKVAAEKSAKALQGTLTEKDGMFRYVEDELLQVKKLYDSRANAVAVERDRALEGLKTAQQEKDRLLNILADAQRRQQELVEASKVSQVLDAMQAQAAQLQGDAVEKDRRLAETSQKVMELEVELKSQSLSVEAQKAASASKMDQLRKLLEELQDLK